MRKHHDPLCLRSHIRVTICAASASRGDGRLGQMGGRAVSSGHAVARRASGQPLCNWIDGLCGLVGELTLKPVAVGQ